VDALEADPGLGAASSKILFAARYWGTKIQAPVTHARGVRLSGVEVDGADVWSRAAFDEGFCSPEAPRAGEVGSRWSKGGAGVRMAAAPGAERPKRMALRLSADSARTVTLTSGGDTRHVSVSTEPVWVEIDLPAEPHDVINNVGSNLYAGGFGGDRGYLE